MGKEQPWNHCIELPERINTRSPEQVSDGKNLVKWSRIESYITKIGINDKRILDVGCSEGFFSLKMQELGAREVVAVDADALRIKKARFIAEVLQVSKIRYKVVDIFENDLEHYGHFDLALCMGFLHRIHHPYKALMQLTRMSDIILLEWKALKEGSFDLPVMKFCSGVTKDANKYSGLYWLLSVDCVVKILKSLGFVHNLIIDNSLWRRSIVVSARVNNPVFQGTHLISSTKPTILKLLTRSYLAGVLRILRDKRIKWL